MSTSEAPASLWRERDFLLYELGRFLSIGCGQMLSVAVGWQVFELTGRALDLGFVGLAQFVPALGLSLVGGQVADRFDRRLILLLSFGLAFICAMALTLLAGAHHGTAPIYAVLVLFGSVRAFSGPAGQALMPTLVPRPLLPKAVAWGSSVWQVAMICGPALGGLIYGASRSAKVVYLVCAILFAVASLCVWFVRSEQQSTSKAPVTFGTVFLGLKYVREHRALLGTISLDLFAVLFGGAVALLPMFAGKGLLNVGPMGLGLLRSAPAVGAASMAFLLTFRPLTRHAGRWMLGCVFLFGLLTIAFGVSKSFPVSLAMLVGLGASDMVSVVVRQSLLQLRTPNEMLGRVSAVNMVFVGASNELGEFESGLTAAYLGPVWATVAGGIGTCAVVALWAVFFPELRTIDRLSDDAP